MSPGMWNARGVQVRYVLGAPGAGKSTALPLLTERLTGWAVLDWDWLMPRVRDLVGRSVRRNPDLWDAYGELVRSVVVSLSSVPLLLTTVCTPDELDHVQRGWPEGDWLLVDCDDEERVRRLRARGESETGVSDAVADAAAYRSLGLPCVQTSGRAIAEVADSIAEWAVPRP